MGPAMINGFFRSGGLIFFLAVSYGCTRWHMRLAAAFAGLLGIYFGFGLH